MTDAVLFGMVVKVKTNDRTRRYAKPAILDVKRVYCNNGKIKTGWMVTYDGSRSISGVRMMQLISFWIWVCYVIL